MWRMKLNNKLDKLLKVNLFISKYLAFSIPFIIWFVVWFFNVAESGKVYVEPQNFLWEILGWNMLFWFVLLIYFILSLVLWGEFREQILTAITFSKERDERESFISGRASKATFYSTLAILILFFFLSGFHIQIYRIPMEEGMFGKKMSLSIGYSIDFVKSDKNKILKFDESRHEKVLEMDGIPFTQGSLLLFIMLYHLASYHLFTRKRFEEI